MLALADVRFEAFRAGGPGGQHQNKTESAVRAVHIATGLAVVARDGRSQHRNKALAIERLAALIHLGAELAAIADRQTSAGRARRHRAWPCREALQGRRLPGVVIVEPWSEKSRGRPAQTRA